MMMMMVMMMMIKIIIMCVRINLLIIITSIGFTIQMDIRVSIHNNRIEVYRCLCRAIFCKIFARRMFFFFAMALRSAVTGLDGEIVVDEQRDQVIEV